MIASRTQRRLFPMLWVAVALLLVVLLLVGQAAPHHGFVPFLVLVPVFLFGLLALSLNLLTACWLEDQGLLRLPVLPARFQRPPPSLFA